MLKDYSSTQLVREMLKRGFSITNYRKSISIESLNHNSEGPFLVSSSETEFTFSDDTETSAFSDIEDALDLFHKLANNSKGQ
jgi:hypothetical protein